MYSNNFVFNMFIHILDFAPKTSTIYDATFSDKEHTKKNPSYVGTQFSVARCWNQKVAQFFEKLVQKVATAVFLSK